MLIGFRFQKLRIRITVDNSYTQAEQNANNAAHDSEKADEWKIGLGIVSVSRD